MLNCQTINNATFSYLPNQIKVKEVNQSMQESGREVCFILVPRGHDPSGLHQGLRPLTPPKVEVCDS